MPTETQTQVGEVTAIWRYPVKSLQGEELNAAVATDRGLLGDRAFAFVDRSEGRIVSAKNPRKWPDLFRFRAAFVEPPTSGQPLPAARITLPDGTIVTTDQPDVDQIVSAALGRDVTLQTSAPDDPALEEYWPDIEGLDYRDTVTVESIPVGGFFDGALIHLLTTATLDTLRRSHSEGHFEVRRFRPNLVVTPDATSADFPENDWIGHTLAIGEQVRIAIDRKCPRCVMTTLPQAHLPHDPNILRTAAQRNEANVGVYASVVQTGVIRCGDAVTLAD